MSSILLTYVGSGQATETIEDTGNSSSMGKPVGLIGYLTLPSVVQSLME